MRATTLKGVGAGALLLFGLAGEPQAARADWRYCLAQDPAERRVFVTKPFSSPDPLFSIEDSFNHWLASSGQRHEWGICPRAASQADIDADRRSAIEYNRTLRLDPTEVAWPDV